MAETTRDATAGVGGAARPARLIAALCLAEILGMASFSAFAALLPELRQLWRLSASEAGWISGVFYAGYTLAVPFLVSVTDRVDPRRIYLLSQAIGGSAALGFALFADGFWSALVFQGVAGIGLAGTYMPGLKALTDRIEGPAQSRAVAFYTSSFGVGTSLSFLLAGLVAEHAPWRWSFAVGAIGAALAIALALAALRPHARPDVAPAGHVLDFRPILRDRLIMGRVVAYAAHNWELFAVRSWIVAYLVHVEAQRGVELPVAATAVAAALTLVGIPGSIGGNEAAQRWGRVRWIVLVMVLSAAMSAVIGFAAGAPLGVLIGLCLVYGGLVAGESAALTASVVAAADPKLRGATMAVYSTLGFFGSFLGPLVFGLVLDRAGWSAAFLSTSAAVLVGPLAVALLRR